MMKEETLITFTLKSRAGHTVKDAYLSSLQKGKCACDVRSFPSHQEINHLLCMSHQTMQGVRGVLSLPTFLKW